jgi:hypothetical protein
MDSGVYLLMLPPGRWPRAGEIDLKPACLLNAAAIDPSVTASREIGCDSSLYERELEASTLPRKRRRRIKDEKRKSARRNMAFAHR